MGRLSNTALQIHFEPLIGEGWIIAFAVIALLLLGVSVFQHRKALLLRCIATALFICALLNPSLLQKQREPVKDVAVVVVDESMSQEMGNRDARTKEALAHIEEILGRMDNVDARIISAPESGGLSSETVLFDALEREFADVPQNRRAGVIILTDGQVHDVPTQLDDVQKYGPVHVLISGEKREKDRRIDITQNPSYGIVDNRVKVAYKVTQSDNIGGVYAQVTLNRFDGSPQVFDVPIGEEQEIEVLLEHAGENIFELSVDAVPGEITEANNRTAIRINGVRDRLKVLLVSGKPHAGGRTWRDLLTSDPGVDLVHFTILREPDKMDATPQNELALIAFPFRELFEVKLYDFDLIVFDRYKLNRILPQHYFDNIATYVKKGGALLEASGPSFATEDSIFYTDIGTILPASPDGNVISAVYKPQVSKLGSAHPVTESLDMLASSGQEASWGAWLRQVSLQPRSGDVLMTGFDDKPLLLLDRVEEGRVAQIGSDHIWLWSRDFQNGGPHAELLRRIVHWLMKEPELDERALKVQVDDNTIRVRSRDTQAESMPLTITKPDGSNEDILLERGENGFLEHIITADQLGIYAFSGNDIPKKFVIIGEQNPPELRDVLASEERLKPVVQASKAGVIWLEDTPTPSLRMMNNSSRYAGRSWLGLKSNHAFTVKSVESKPVLPSWAWLFVLAGILIATWWREGRSQ
jgi:hypothetical protein